MYTLNFRCCQCHQLTGVNNSHALLTKQQLVVQQAAWSFSSAPVSQAYNNKLHDTNKCVCNTMHEPYQINYNS